MSRLIWFPIVRAIDGKRKVGLQGVCVKGVQKGCSGKGGNEHKGCGESEGASSASVGKRERLQKETENYAICISRLTRAD